MIATRKHSEDGRREHEPALTVLIVGPFVPELEIVAQGLASAGIEFVHVIDLEEAAARVADVGPVALIVARAIAAAHPHLASRACAASGAVLLWHPFDSAADPALPTPLQRLVVADLALPLERRRLVTLVQVLLARAGEARHPPAERNRPADHDGLA